uniref:Uncharacterized protein n=1 Tax=viral metagenome TaxID=1070528 RepID=A0A6M3LQH0_9ZZZZ
MKHKRRIDEVFHDLLHYQAKIASYLEYENVVDANKTLLEMAEYTRNEMVREMGYERKSDD